MPSRKQLANAIRVLSMDAIQKANSGHPGAPMGMADIAEALWGHVLKHNPANPGWFDRDRFVLSNGHGSMLLYSLLHLTGYELSMDEIKNFRQMGSETPGHPEYGDTVGVETTTGPLGQGICNGVGMALAERALAAEFNHDGHEIVDHYTYVLMGDGCMMEGVSHEACSLAGTMGLGKLVAFWDDNGISIDGEVDTWWNDDTATRFEAYNWHVIRDVDGHDAASLDKAIAEARAETGKPTLICCRTVIGCGAPKAQGKHTCHGSPLGDEEITNTRKALGWDAEPFIIPEDIYADWNARDKGAQAEAAWNEKFEAYKAAFPAEAAEFVRRMNNELPVDWAAKADAVITKTNEEAEKLATRKASQAAIKKFAELLPEFLGGSADLTPSNGTRIPAYKSLVPGDFSGRYISYGVREFGMGAVMNGVALHGGLLPYAGTFLIFSDYARNAIRMAALMGIRVIWVLTHDSIGVGEDGPTHQPVEQIPSLRLIPDLDVWRPCDTLETAVAWRQAVEAAGPSCLAFTRQTTGFATRTAQQIEDVEKGGYVLDDCDGTPDAILIGTGSEVFLALEAKKLLAEKGKKIRVVSMPCTERFDGQDKAYRDFVLPPAVTARVAVEAAATDGWYKYVGLDGAVVGMKTFGASAPGAQLFTRFGFTSRAVAEIAESIL